MLRPRGCRGPTSCRLSSCNSYKSERLSSSSVGKTLGHLLARFQAPALKYVKEPLNHLLAKKQEMSRSINTHLFRFLSNSVSLLQNQ